MSDGVIAFVGLGSNLEQPVSQINRAFEELDRLPGTRCLRRSPLYLSRPVGPEPQPDYLNAVAQLRTVLGAHALLHELQAVEQAHQRVRGVRWGPRTLDLDLLLYADEVIESPDLKVPHPGLQARSFVICPLFDVAPELHIPNQGALRDLRRGCSTADLRPYRP
jgi:2-amino-4-hydroxy-6-hydroxymethyldihydropteridine diphosphokinase